MPCLDEADTVETCVRKAREFLARHGVAGEVIVADNGSTDGSQELATRAGARVVPVSARGYGFALLEGIGASRGRYVIMGDADDSYDFSALAGFIEKLRAGFDLVQGCRLPAGGGTILPGAMPFSHRWLGNPMLSAMARLLFHAPVTDIYCGLRGFSRALYDRLGLRCTGMEFATEMIVKATLQRSRITEVPITLHPDGRKSHPPHLRTFRDGWRTLRFFLLYSPRWLFLYPGIALVLLGGAGYAIALPGLQLRGITFDVHTLLCASLAVIMGSQALFFAIFARTFAVREGLLPEHRTLTRLYQIFTLEKGLVLGVASFGIGVGILSGVLREWQLLDFQGLDYASTMRRVIPSVTLMCLGFQTVLFSFLISLLGISRK